MHHKDIKATIRKSLKKSHPRWRSLTKKQKKELAKNVYNEAVNGYDFNNPVDTPISELLGIENQIPTSPNIMDLDSMEQFIENHHNSKLFRLYSNKRHPLIKDEELKFIDDILDDQIINRILSYHGYRPSIRTFFPCNFLRAEILKALKYPEISYRKFTGEDKRYNGATVYNPYTGMEQKQNRAFIGLPLNKHEMINHVQMSQFRTSLTFTQQTNMLVYILHHFKKHGFLDDESIHCVDSTELPVYCSRPLLSIEVNGKKIRIYDDIDCDCGKRRNKRDKSPYVVGYRMHTLTAINPKTGHSYPLVSLLAAANHHDSHFLTPLAMLGTALGIDVKLITADEAYNEKSSQLWEQTGIHLVKPANSKVKLPENVDPETMAVTIDDFCEIPMQYMGIDGQCHEYKCGAESGECPRKCICNQFRQISFDNGKFQRIKYGSDDVRKALNIRKNGERPFNLLKKREGLDEVRVRSQNSLQSRSTITTIVTLLIEMAGTRQKVDKEPLQQQLTFDFASGF